MARHSTARVQPTIPNSSRQPQATGGQQNKVAQKLGKHVKIQGLKAFTAPLDSTLPASQKEMEERVSRALMELGLEQEDTEVAAVIAVRSHLEKKLHESLSTIPIYSELKQLKRQQHIKWDVIQHLETYYRDLIDSGLLYRDDMRHHDASFVKNLEGWCTRNDLPQAPPYLPPTQNERTKKRVSELDYLTGTEARNASRNALRINAD